MSSNFRHERLRDYDEIARLYLRQLVENRAIRVQPEQQQRDDNIRPTMTSTYKFFIVLQLLSGLINLFNFINFTSLESSPYYNSAEDDQISPLMGAMAIISLLTVAHGVARLVIPTYNRKVVLVPAEERERITINVDVCEVLLPVITMIPGLLLATLSSIKLLNSSPFILAYGSVLAGGVTSLLTTVPVACKLNNQR